MVCFGPKNASKIATEMRGSNRNSDTPANKYPKMPVCDGPCSPSSQRVSGMIAPQPNQTTQTPYEKPKIETVDNGFEYQGKNVWRDIETGQEYPCDKQGRIIRKKDKQNFLEKLFSGFPLYLD